MSKKFQGEMHPKCKGCPNRNGSLCYHPKTMSVKHVWQMEDCFMWGEEPDMELKKQTSDVQRVHCKVCSFIYSIVAGADTLGVCPVCGTDQLEDITNKSNFDVEAALKKYSEWNFERAAEKIASADIEEGKDIVKRLLDKGVKAVDLLALDVNHIGLLRLIWRGDEEE